MTGRCHELQLYDPDVGSLSYAGKLTVRLTKTTPSQLSKSLNMLAGYPPTYKLHLYKEPEQSMAFDGGGSSLSASRSPLPSSKALSTTALTNGDVVVFQTARPRVPSGESASTLEVGFGVGAVWGSLKLRRRTRKRSGELTTVRTVVLGRCGRRRARG